MKYVSPRYGGWDRSNPRSRRSHQQEVNVLPLVALLASLIDVGRRAEDDHG